MDFVLQTFQAQCPRLFAIAYRMLGTRADADDVLQDAWLRWSAADHQAIETPQAWLTTVVTRLAIDRLREVQTTRQQYVGWWLPEPLVEALNEDTPERQLEHVGDVSMAMLWMLERLTPHERAAFLMREVFEHDYSDIAASLGKTEAACRQLVHRAMERIKQGRARLKVSHEQHRQVLQRFIEAARSGEREAMKALSAPDITAIGDGGGKVPSIMKMLQGPERIANLYYAIHRRLGTSVRYRLGLVNGETGVLRYVDGQLESVQCFVVADARICGIYTVRNPDKLRHVPADQKDL